MSKRFGRKQKAKLKLELEDCKCRGRALCAALRNELQNGLYAKDNDCWDKAVDMIIEILTRKTNNIPELNAWVRSQGEKALMARLSVENALKGDL